MPDPLYTFVAILFTVAIVSVAGAFLMLCHLERMADIARSEVDVL